MQTASASERVNEQFSLISSRDDGATEFRIFGPPGCGKTTHTSRQIKRAVDKYGPQSILITSFSRAAAAELVQRDLPVDRDRIGTLHAHCYRALNRPNIAETKVSDWNETYPYWPVTGGVEHNLDDPSEEASKGGAGDQLLAVANRWRNRKMPIELWADSQAKRFFEKWCDWKRANHLMDFTDLLEVAALDCKIAPGNPRVIFADEAQDFTRLQLELIRRWGAHTDYFLVVGDDDQTIYTFTGATPEAFLNPPVPDEQKIVLSQSYRVPQAVHALAVRWIEKVSQREPKEYRPTSEPGAVENMRASLNRADVIVDAAEHELDAGNTVMFLTTCSYMLTKIRNVLVDRAIPFHNPYRRRRGDWNPLYAAKGTTAAERVLTFLKPHHSNGEHAQPWTAQDYQRWSDWVLAKDTFVPGGKSGTKDWDDTTLVTVENLLEWLEPDAYSTLMNGLMNEPVNTYLDWWLKRVLATKEKTAAFPVRIAQRRGAVALLERPRVILGTIHSVKGGESDVVYLFPDLSRPAGDEWERGGEFADSIVRQFYVGMTRARKKLVLCEPSGLYRVAI